MSDPLEVVASFNKAVESTEVIGGIKADVADVKADVAEIKGDVKHIRTTLDRYAGAIAISSAAVSIAVSIVVSLFKP